MPAAAVIPALRAYANIVAAKKLVVEFVRESIYVILMKYKIID